MHICRYNLCVALLLSSCVATHEPLAQNSVTISFACARMDRSVYQTAADAFHSLNPDIQVRIVAAEDIAGRTSAASTQPVAVARAVYEVLGTLAAGVDSFVASDIAVEGGDAWLLDLTPFISAGNGPSEEDFLKGLWQRFEWQSGMWGLPASVDPTVIYYRSDIFQRADLRQPALNWTWDQLLHAAEQLSASAALETTKLFGLADPGYQGVRSFIPAHGGTLVNIAETTPRPALNAPATVAAIQAYINLAVQQKVMLLPHPGSVYSLLQSQQAAMVIGNASDWWDLGALRQHLRIAAVPQGGPVVLNGYYISAKAAYPAAAWRWLQFINGRVAPADGLPAHAELWASSSQVTEAGEATANTLRFAVEHGLSPIRPAATATLLDFALERTFAGQALESALDEAQKQALEIIALPVTLPATTTNQLAPVAEAVEQITFLSSAVQPSYLALIKAFQENHSDIEIKLVYEFEMRDIPSGDTQYWTLDEIAAKSHADCFFWPIIQKDPEWKAVLDLEPFIEAEARAIQEDYYPWALEPLYYQGKLHGLPGRATALTVYYNHTLFDTLGLVQPQPNWTWTDLFATAQKLAGSDQDGQRFGFAIGSRPIELLTVIGAEDVFAATIRRDEGQPVSLQFAIPEIVNRVGLLADRVKHGVIPAPTDPKIAGQAGISQLIASGRVGMRLGHGAPPLTPFFVEHVSVAPWPTGGSCISPMLDGAYYIAAKTQHAQSCWQWLNFLSTRLPADMDGLSPSRSSVIREALRSQVGAQTQQRLQAALECDEAHSDFQDIPGLPYSHLGYFWLEDALQRIIWNQTELETALNQAQNHANSYLACLRARPDPADWPSAVECVKQIGLPGVFP